MKKIEIFSLINCYNELRYNDPKISYFILKPNSIRNYAIIIDEIEKNFNIVNQYAILDYNKVNTLLHKNQSNSRKYLIPISKYYIDYYGNYGILVLIEKDNIFYSDFCVEVCQLKQKIRNMLKQDYFSFIFDISKLGEENYRQTIGILSCNDKIIKKDSINKNGTFMIFSINELHSPDFTLQNTINELNLLASLDIFEETNKIDFEILTNIRKYKTFEFLKDLN